MINANQNPVQWTLLVDELNEARQHLETLVSEMMTDTDFGESRFAVDMGHVMAHLNRAWARRNHTRELTDAEWETFREYPQDLRPIA